jgi:predicted GH43/DUF377 family glycosyl hydrolase
MKSNKNQRVNKVDEKLLLEPKDFKPSFNGAVVEGVMNPAAIRLPNKKIMLYVRVAESYKNESNFPMHQKLNSCPVIYTGTDYKEYSKEFHDGKVLKMGGNIVMFEEGICRLKTLSHFIKVLLSKDGFTVEKIYQKPDYTGKGGSKNNHSYGVEDPRIVKMGKRYLMTYVSVHEREGICTSLSTSYDLKTWDKKGIIFREQNKDAFIFPEKIRGKYVAIHRPEGFFEFSRPSIWISHSHDLIHWGEEKVIMQPRKGWEEKRIGGGAPPIKTKKGWLLIYHGVRNENDESFYSAGAAMLDLKDPSKVIARSPKDTPLFHPSKEYETNGFTQNVVFPTGAIPSLDKKDLLIFFGGADQITGVKKISFNEIFDHMDWYE